MDVRGWAGADRVEAWGPVAVSISQNVPVVTVPSLNVGSTGLYLDLACAPWADWLCDFTTDNVVPLLADRVEDTLAGVVGEALEPLLEDFLASYRVEPAFSLPAPLGHTDGSPDLYADAGLDRMVFCGPNADLPHPATCPSVSPNPGYAQIDYAVQVYPPERGSDIADGEGAIRRNPTCTSPTGAHCLAGSCRRSPAFRRARCGSSETV
jgi:hypothetical protein